MDRSCSIAGINGWINRETCSRIVGILCREIYNVKKERETVRGISINISNIQTQKKGI